MKKLAITILFTLFLLYCLLYPKEMAASTSAGLALWYQNVVPTLLPFSILSYIIIYSNLYHAIFSKIAKLFPRLSAQQVELLYPILFGYLFGFPIGAKLIADLYETGHISGQNLTRYTALCNHFGPAFIINYVGMIQLQDQIAPYKLILSAYLPSVLLFIILFLFDGKNNIHYSEKKQPYIETKKKPASRSHINIKILDTGIINGFETMLRIAGYIVLFSILSGATHQLPGQHSGFLSLVTGLLEVTTGIQSIVSQSLPIEVLYPMVCGILSFGGFCGLFQTKAIMKNCPFHITSYFVLKLICCVISILIACFLNQL